MNRRHFLRHLGMAGLTSSGLLNSLGRMSAMAQTTATDDYKALVCVYLYGGNDSNNMLIPIDGPEYRTYTETRGGLALQQSTILPLTGGRFGVHPAMPNVQAMFNSGQLAMLANVGTLLNPLTKAQFIAGTASIPPSLMSHSDQQTLIETGLSSSAESIGWGGAMADVLAASYQSPVVPMCTSMFGPTAFINGRQMQGFLSPGLSAGAFWCPIGSACANRDNALKGLLSVAEGNALVSADQANLSQVIALNQSYGSIMTQATPLKTPFQSAFDVQFETVARMIQQRQNFEAKRQVFYVGLSTFDTHADQLGDHATMLQALDGGLQTFASALQELGVYDKVTTFTLSDFSRTLQGNAAGGTDHAWGSHHLIMGGAVKGGSVYGTFPTLDPTGPDDLGENDGRWIPTTSVVQMGAALASWFGVQPAEMGAVFPQLANFPGQPLTFI